MRGRHNPENDPSHYETTIKTMLDVDGNVLTLVENQDGERYVIEEDSQTGARHVRVVVVDGEG